MLAGPQTGCSSRNGGAAVVYGAGNRTWHRLEALASECTLPHYCIACVQTRAYACIAVTCERACGARAPAPMPGAAVCALCVSCINASLRTLETDTGHLHAMQRAARFLLSKHLEVGAHGLTTVLVGQHLTRCLVGSKTAVKSRAPRRASKWNARHSETCKAQPKCPRVVNVGSAEHSAHVRRLHSLGLTAAEAHS